MKLNKAAMFGLDARIALAIFGTLSVISGAALYSAIQQSKVVAVVNELDELGKAMDSYFLDVEEMLPRGSSVNFNVEELLFNVSMVNNWQGPYISKTRVDQTSISSNNGLKNAVVYRTGVDWGGKDGDAALPTTCSGPCYVWTVLVKAESNIAHAVDEYVDGERDNKKGRIRVWDYTTSDKGKSTIYYQYAIAPVQP